MGGGIEVWVQNGDLQIGTTAVITIDGDDLTTDSSTVKAKIWGILEANGTDNAARGAYTIHVKPYFNLSDGSKVYGAEVSRSFQSIIESLDSKFASAGAAQQVSLKELYTTYGMGNLNWNIPNLKMIGEA